jgi:multisubunit Na+/H+ antiporter MnhB subunit
VNLATLATAFAVGGLGLFLAYAALDMAAFQTGLASNVNLEMEASGVRHPVTAVLLNFRAYDTWLELEVLLIAAVAALQSRAAAPPPALKRERDPLHAWAVWALVPLMTIAAAHVLSSGAYGPGGAFQGGALLAAAIVLLRLNDKEALLTLPPACVRILLALGVASFAAAAGSSVVKGRMMLEYAPGHAAAMILAIETAALVSIAAALATIVNTQLARDIR